MNTADPILGIAGILKADSAVASLVGVRVFGSELPETETDHMPRACVVVADAGAPNQLGNAYNRWGDIRVNTRCYGATPYQARRVALAVHTALKQARRATHSGCLVHWANPAGGSPPLRDPDTDWPYLERVWQALVSEQPVL